MIIGVPREIKNNEYRVGLTAAGVHELTHAGHEVLVEASAGLGAGVRDEDFAEAGARIVPDAADVWGGAEMIVKVKEPLPSEQSLLREGQILFTYLHLAADETLTRAVLDSGTTAIAYETVQRADRSLPLLAPMSAIAGRLATQVAAYHLMKPLGGSGVLMGGVPGTGEAKVLVIGGGVVGEQAAVMANGLHADVTVMDVSLARLQEIATVHSGRILTRYSTRLDLSEMIRQADVVIGSVLIPGKRAPKLVTDEMVSTMKPGSVLVDVAIDQGGCFEGSHATTHDAPTFRVHDTNFYCVANMPGSVPVTATAALTHATLPYVMRIAGSGWRDALRADAALAKGLNAHAGTLTNIGVGEAHGTDAVEPAVVLG
ncbi:alanine dehydrogenase [Brachybacterium sp. MASK1Z-5]|uniref:Alanine dehydrogenase n=1 Tax=Brachybacterium halotolerans TaxID=2795215 RepID=A0ABS1B5J8_9MICO|nr:alanine dehydrogenase [Brachybacterium halotolerans]MBK0329908.1 alanine dehydrogenase [Brachybacterium halotolerans]